MSSLSIAIFVFNRPKYTKALVKSIKRYNYKKLYVFCDEGRNEEEKQKVNEVKEIIKKANLPRIETHYSEFNKGCKSSIIDGVDYFFQKEDFGVILEDDCIPEIGFFEFCEHANKQFSDNKRVGMVSGTNYLFNHGFDGAYLSKVSSIWGWATWADRWNNVEFEIKEDVETLSSKLATFYKNDNYTAFVNDMMVKVINGELDAWSLHFLYFIVKNDLRSLTPGLNLISNIGEEGTRYGKKSPFIKMPTASRVNLLSNTITDNEVFDKIVMENITSKSKEYWNTESKGIRLFCEKVKDKIKLYLK